MNRDDERLRYISREICLVFGGLDQESTIFESLNHLIAAERESMRANGWRQCAVGQKATQHCAMAERDTALLRQALAALNQAVKLAEATGWSGGPKTIETIDALRERLGEGQ